MPDDLKQTKFEQDLAVYFPDIYKIHQMSKFDKFLWDAIYSLLEMSHGNCYGEVKVLYQNGKINQVLTTKSVVSSALKRPNLNFPGTLD
jgi:hypothetical protein